MWRLEWGNGEAIGKQEVKLVHHFNAHDVLNFEMCKTFEINVTAKKYKEMKRNEQEWGANRDREGKKTVAEKIEYGVNLRKNTQKNNHFSRAKQMLYDNVVESNGEKLYTFAFISEEKRRARNCR